MKILLLSACAAALIASGASAASASDIVIRHDNAGGAIIRIDDGRPGNGWNSGGYGYRGENYDWNNDGYGYRSQNYDWNNGGYGYRSQNYDWNNGGYRYGDRDHGMVSPRWIVRNLQRHDYRYISRPVLAGRFYQVKAISPRGHKVKLYIDAYSGRIVRVKA